MNNGSVMALGIMVGVMIAAWVLARKNRNKESEYDEMQQKIRAGGYRIGFFTSLFLMLVVILLYEMNLLTPVTPGFAVYAALILSVTVFAVYCILRDAFLSVRGKAGSYLVIFGLITAVESIVTIRYLAEGKMIMDGKLSFAGGAPALMAVCFLTILATLVVKTIRNRKEEKE